MRLTVCLLKQKLRRLMKLQWKHRGFYHEPTLFVPDYLKGMKIQEPGAEPFSSVPPPSPFELPKDDPRFMPPPRPEDDPDWHETPIYDFTPETGLLEGESQALLLTKTKPVYRLPQNVSDLIGVAQQPDQDELVQRYIMQANKWDPTKEKLPKRYNPELPIWKFKAEFGIPELKQQSIFLQNLMRLCQSFGGQYPDLLQNRRLCSEHQMSTFYYFQGEKHIRIQGTCDWVVSTDKPLSPFASTDEVDSTVTHQLPDLFPVAPTIDLNQVNIWRTENITGWNEGATHPYTHTMVLGNRGILEPSQLAARALIFCFAHCVAQAKAKYGWDVEKLPEPISTQCIHTNGQNFNFICYQLNTMNFVSGEGVKNIAWIDNDNILYQKLLPKRAMLRNTKYEDYDPHVLQKIIALYMNGVNISRNQ